MPFARVFPQSTHPHVTTGENEVQIECKTCMTSITIAISVDSNNYMTKLDQTYLDHDEIIKYTKEHDDMFTRLGYSAFMFLDWIKEAKIAIQENKIDEMKVYFFDMETIGGRDVKTLEQEFFIKAYIKGVEVVKRIINES